MAERARARTVYICTECGQESLRWQGRCPECQAWNTLVERTVPARPTPAMGRGRVAGPAPAPVPLAEVAAEAYPRLEVGIAEFDRVLGGGIVPGALVLIGGDPGIGKCLAGSTRVLDPSSGDFLPITAWAATPRPVLSLDTTTHRLAARPVAAFRDNGVQPVVEVTTRLGRTLRCTPSHPVLTPAGWRPVGDLSPGTRIAGPRSLPVFGQEPMDDHAVRRIAHALSDGSATSRMRVVAALSEVERDPTGAAQLRRPAEAARVPVAAPAPDARDRAALKAAAARLPEAIGGRWATARTKAVPDRIFRLPRAQLALFLKVLFSCDGSLFVNAAGTPGLSYTTVSRCLAEDVQHLLLRFGFVAGLRTTWGRVGGRPSTAYELQVLGVAEVKRFLREIGIWGREDAEGRIAAPAAPEDLSAHWDTDPTFRRELRPATGGASFRDVSAAAATVVRNRRHERPPTRATVAALARAFPSPFLHGVATGDVYWDEIASITSAGEERVYDLTVPPHQNFIANDLVVHNSTLLLEVAARVAGDERRVLYISGEESAHQLKLRAARLGIHGRGMYLLTETNIGEALAHADQLQPDLVIVDSIQTVYAPELPNAAGSVAQLRETTLKLMQWAKAGAVPVVIVGHVTKEGEIAGPRLLEHIVDVVLYLEGERFSSYRLLRGVKNRFGAVSEVGVFEMAGRGLVPVDNPSEIFLAERPEGAIGSVIVPTVEGSRPLLVEVQALTSPTSLSLPRRTANGIDFNRLLLITAVLTKRAGVRLSDQDVIVNVVGGLRIQEPAADLAVALAIASSHRDALLPGDLVAVGELGLSGELRSVSHLERRLAEAERLGFARCVLPRAALRRGCPQTALELLPMESLAQALDAVCADA
jgi:DNA repair protein RadA/Sms